MNLVFTFCKLNRQSGTTANYSTGSCRYGMSNRSFVAIFIFTHGQNANALGFYLEKLGKLNHE